MRFFLIVWGVISILVPVVNAEMQMSSGNEYGSYTITGDEGYFDAYLRFPSSGVSVSAYEGSDAQVTDLGVTAKQNHLFRIAGINGDLFQISGDGGAVELLDISMSRIGVYSNELDPVFHADAGGPYTTGPGQSVTLDAGLSYLARNYGWNSGANAPDSIEAAWKIDGQSVGSLITFDSLVNELGLSYGMHTVSLDATAWVNFGEFMPFDGLAVSTIEIIPEPATMILLGLGGIFLRSRKF